MRQTQAARARAMHYIMSENVWQISLNQVFDRVDSCDIRPLSLVTLEMHVFPRNEPLFVGQRSLFTSGEDSSKNRAIRSHCFCRLYCRGIRVLTNRDSSSVVGFSRP